MFCGTLLIIAPLNSGNSENKISSANRICKMEVLSNHIINQFVYLV